MTLAKPLSFLVVTFFTGLSTPAAAVEDSPEKCEHVIARAAGAYLAKHTGVLKRCQKLRVQGILPADFDCTTDGSFAAEIAGLRLDLEEAIGKTCGGADEKCGTGDDMTLAEIGWDGVTQCPDIDGSGCTGAITGCADVTSCIECTGAAAAEQMVELSFGNFATDQFGTESDANACQLAIGRGATKFLQVSARALAKCWVARIAGKQDGDCPDGTGKDGEMIAKAEAKKDKIICKACGGGDEACGGGDDLAVDTFGFASDCPDVSVPSGGSCGGAILDVPDVVACVDCVAKFKAECMARLAAPGVGDYPAVCNPGSSITTTTTTPGATTTTVGGLCGNGVIDSGEACDPASSAGGAFGCPAGTTCTAQCTCSGGATSTTCNATTTTTTTTVPGGTCGNGVLDPGEECDMSSPAGSFVCPPGCTCNSLTCKCVPIGATTTTVPSGCGNGRVDRGEDCDASSPSGSFTCAPGTECTASCTCAGPSTTSTTLGGATSTTTSPGATTTAPVTTTTQPTGTASFLDFTTGLSDEFCGAYFEDTAMTEDGELDELSCGGLNIGGGTSTVLEGPTPDGSTSRFTVSCNGDSCTLGATNTAGATYECTGTGCAFGPPLPVPNAGISTCVVNTFSGPASGTVDLSTGAISASIALSSRVILTGNANQPCPICRIGSVTGNACAGTPGSPCTGKCQGSPNEGATCTSTNSQGLSRDCPAPAVAQGVNRCYGGPTNGAECTSSSQCGGGICAQLIGSIPVNLSPLTTGIASKTNAGGTFCNGQAFAGCFGDEDCRGIRETGAAGGSLLPVGSSHAVTLASVFCIPSAGSPIIDSSASLPGPGATSLPGTVTLVP